MRPKNNPKVDLDNSYRAERDFECVSATLIHHDRPASGHEIATGASRRHMADEGAGSVLQLGQAGAHNPSQSLIQLRHFIQVFMKEGVASFEAAGELKVDRLPSEPVALSRADSGLGG
jgi:hypothetical protein